MGRFLSSCDDDVTQLNGAACGCRDTWLSHVGWYLHSFSLTTLFASTSIFIKFQFWEVPSFFFFLVGGGGCDEVWILFVSCFFVSFIASFWLLEMVVCEFQCNLGVKKESVVGLAVDCFSLIKCELLFVFSWRKGGNLGFWRLF